MAKVLFHYDTVTCKYEIYEPSGRDRLKSFLIFFSIAFLLAVGIIFLYGRFYPHPEISFLKQERNEILTDINQLNSNLSSLISTQASIDNRDREVYRMIVQAGLKKKEAKLTYNTSNKSQFQLVNEVHHRLNKLKLNIYSQIKSFSEIISTAQRKSELLESMPAIDPVDREFYHVSSPFGWRRRSYGMQFHQGMDFAALIGTPIYATGNGRIKLTKKSYRGYGNQIDIDHGFGIESRYAHMKRFIVKTGEEVKRGQLIGYVGNTGSSTGPHLHYEIKINGKKTNPYPYISGRSMPNVEYKKIIRAANN